MSSRPITHQDILDAVAALAAREYECPKYEYQPVQPYGSEQIDCHLCHGTGRVPLIPELREPSLHSMGYGPVGNMWLPILRAGQSPEEQKAAAERVGWVMAVYAAKHINDMGDFNLNNTLVAEDLEALLAAVEQVAKE